MCSKEAQQKKDGRPEKMGEERAKALMVNIDQWCRWRIRCNANDRKEYSQSVFERILTGVRDLKIDLHRLQTCPEYERQVIRTKVEAVRSQLRRDRKKAMRSLKEGAGVLCRESERYEEQEHRESVLKRALASLSDEDRKVVALHLSGDDHETQAARLGVTKVRLAKMKHNGVQHVIQVHFNTQSRSTEAG